MIPVIPWELISRQSGIRKINHSGTRIYVPPATTVWQNGTIAFVVAGFPGCCKCSLWISIPAQYTIYRCIEDAIQSFIQFSIYKVILIWASEIICMPSFDHSSIRKINLTISDIPASGFIIPDSRIGKINSAVITNIPPGSVIFDYIPAVTQTSFTKIVPAIDTIYGSIADACKVLIYTSVCHIICLLSSIFIVSTCNSSITELYLAVLYIPFLIPVGTKSIIREINLIIPYIPPASSCRLYGSIGVITHLSVFHVVPIAVIQLHQSV